MAEVWHSYMERMLVSATNEEKAKRLAAELELERARQAKETEIFSAAEEKDFAFIWSALDRYEPITVERITQPTKTTTTYQLDLYLRSFIPLASRYTNYRGYDYHSLAYSIGRQASPFLPPCTESAAIGKVLIPDLAEELRMYGLLTGVTTSEENTGTNRLQTVFYLVYAEKYSRFRYWLAVKGQLPQALTLRLKGEGESKPIEGHRRKLDS